MSANGLYRNAHYVRIKREDGLYLPGFNFQDRYVGQTRTYGGVDYEFADMEWTGVASASDGDSSELSGSVRATPAAFALASYCRQALLTADVAIVQILDDGVSEPTEALTPLLVVSRAIISSTFSDRQVITFQMASPLLAGASGAGRRYQEQDVGALPPSGNFSVL